MDAKAKKKEAGRVAITTMNASNFNGETGIGNVPEVSMLSRRLTLDLHTREVLGEMNIGRKVRKSIKNGDNPLGGKNTRRSEGYPDLLLHQAECLQ